MKQKNGFIAISLIYSFFLVFLMTLTGILVNYAQNRILVNNVINETKDYLNNHVEVDTTKLNHRTYNSKENVLYAGLTWQVLKENSEDDSVTLVLNRNLTTTEINNILVALNFNVPHINENIRMCLTTLSDFYCYQTSLSDYKIYTWHNSIVKAIIEEWFKEQTFLQKALTRNSLIPMSISLNEDIDTSYIRIMDLAEAQLIGNSNVWTYTYAMITNGISYVKNSENGNVSTLTEHAIRPVIRVKKN